MQYLGGKYRIAGPLTSYLRSRQGERRFVEPFCGALNVTARMAGRRVACDASPYLFSLYTAIRRGWNPPAHVSREEYEQLRERKDPTDPMTAFAGYGCSWGGKFFGGYAQNPAHWAPRSANARNSLLKKMAACADVVFACCDYRVLCPGSRDLVYGDPPYRGTTGYAALEPFDSAAFWDTARGWARAGALVLVSEYSAPDDFRVVWEMETRTDLHGAGRSGRLERLFEFTGA